MLVTLGRVGTMKLPAARKAAWTALDKFKSGKYNQEKKALGANTFGALALGYIEDEPCSKRQGKTVENYLRMDWLGEVPLVLDHSSRARPNGAQSGNPAATASSATSPPPWLVARTFSIGSTASANSAASLPLAMRWTPYVV